MSEGMTASEKRIMDAINLLSQKVVAVEKNLGQQIL
jgi:hypothetical protein